MRGIAGIIHFDGSPVPPGLIDMVIHRMAVGPTDRIGAWTEGSAGLAHLIRAIAPEDRLEVQPLRPADGSVALVSDALLENRDELARDLGIAAAVLPTLPDSALVLRAYGKWGEDFTQHLEGKFAIALWNPRARKLFCFVDHFAFRPLYYFHRGGRLVFASTLHGMFAVPGVPRRLNDAVLADFMLTQPADPGVSLYQDIGIVPAGCQVEVDASGLRIRPYWRPDRHREIKLSSPEEYLEAFTAELTRAVAGGLRGEKMVGSMCSGGLDSAAGTAIAGRILAERGQRLQVIHTMRGTTDPRRSRLRDHDESVFVRQLQGVSPHMDFHYLPATEVRPISLSRWTEVFENTWVPFRGAVTEPDENAVSPLAHLEFSRMLYGFGGNYVVSLECAGSSYLAQLAIRLRWVRMLREAARHRRVYRGSFKQTLKSQVLKPMIEPFRRSAEPRLDFLPCLNPDFARRSGFQERMGHREHRLWDPNDFNVRRQRAWIMTDLMPQSRGISGSVLGKGYSCESHLPYFDRRLNEFCLGVPVEQQIRDGWDRILLRKASKGLLPDSVAWRITRGYPSEGLWEAGQRLRQVLPAALEEMEKSTLVGNYLDLKRIRREFVDGAQVDNTDQSPWMAVKRLNDLFGAGWFLRWLDNQPGG
jgi:asparagine synthase (glutamine-hydrolysing)